MEDPVNLSIEPLSALRLSVRNAGQFGDRLELLRRNHQVRPIPGLEGLEAAMVEYAASGAKAEKFLARPQAGQSLVELRDLLLERNRLDARIAQLVGEMIEEMKRRMGNDLRV